MMRPKSLEWFDRIFYVSIAILLGTGYLNVTGIRDQMIEQHVEDYTPLLTAALSLLLNIAVTTLNWYFVSRRGNKIAIVLWIIINLFSVLTLPKLIKVVALSDMPFVAIAPSLLGTFLACASVIMLFQRDAQIWFKAQQGTKDPQ
jgi:predicted membrane channel-forming protein YqfA (hemolysin III family)